MKNYVQGYLSKNNLNAQRFLRHLDELGYELTGNRFKKYGKIEAVVNEVVPYAETEGIDVFRELNLAEYDGKGKVVARYEEGRVDR